MTDSELRQAFSKGFANPEHLHELLRRTDLQPNRQIDVRANLSQAYLSRQITDDALQRFISQLSKAKNLDQFDQVLAEPLPVIVDTLTTRTEGWKDVLDHLPDAKVLTKA